MDEPDDILANDHSREPNNSAVVICFSPYSQHPISVYSATRKVGVVWLEWATANTCNHANVKSRA